MSAVPITWPHAGELNRVVRVRPWLSQPNPDMGITETFGAGITRYAKVEPVSGAAYYGSVQVGEIMTHRIWLRYGPGTRETDITPQHVIDWEARNQRFRVLRATNAGGGDEMTMVECKLLGAIG